MSEDKLKRFVIDNREKFEVHETDLDSLWSGIDQAVKKEAAFKWGNLLKVAATVILIAVVGMVGLRVAYQGQISDGIALHQISPDLAETEYFYFQQIEEKISIIKASQGELDPQILNDLAALDSAYKDLKMDLSENIGNEEIINAMIENYRIKLMILEQILEQINKDNNDKKEEVESA